MSEGVSDRLSRHVAATRYEDIAPAAIEAAKRSLLDAIGVSLGASSEQEGVPAFVALALEAGGKREASIFGWNAKAPAGLAAFANGAMAHALDFEDAYDGAPLHPNAALIPAVLAVAQARGGVSGRELLAAIVLGCDLTCRLALCLRTQAETFGWYPPPIFGAYGAVAAVGRVIGLDPKRMRDAFSLALCQATCSGEIKYSPDSVVRAVRDAFPAQTGVVSALLAERGVVGFDAPFEGKAGFFRLYAGGDYDQDVFFGGLGARFRGADVSFKPWPSCRGTHAFIEAAIALREEPGLLLDNIVGIEMSGDAMQQMLASPIESKRAPRTAIDAKFSSPFVVATALLRGAVTLDDFTPEALRDQRVLALAAVASHAIDSSFGTSAGGALRLRLADGQVLERRIDTPVGDPTRPLSWDTLVGKAKACGARAKHPANPSTIEALAHVISAIEREEDAAAAIFAALENPA